jgi:hypothetical protein
MYLMSRIWLNSDADTENGTSSVLPAHGFTRIPLKMWQIPAKHEFFR